MTESQGEVATPTQKPALPKAHPLEQFVVIVAFVLTFVILFDVQARDFTGRMVGAVLEPTIGFGRAFPVLTIFLAGVIMVIVTSAVRDFFTDYLRQARNQEVMRAFSREMKEARKSNNLHRMKKLTEKNKELMAVQAEQSTSQLKPMAITMLVVIPIFAWLAVFVAPPDAGTITTVNCATEGTVVSVPWDRAWCTNINVQAPIPLLNLFPRWIALYSLFSIPVQPLVQRALKAGDLQRGLAKAGAAT